MGEDSQKPPHPTCPTTHHHTPPPTERPWEPREGPATRMTLSTRPERIRPPQTSGEPPPTQRGDSRKAPKEPRPQPQCLVQGVYGLCAVQVKGLKTRNYPGCSKRAQSDQEASKWSRSPGWGPPGTQRGSLASEGCNVKKTHSPPELPGKETAPRRPGFQPSDAQLDSCPGEQDNPSGWFRAPAGPGN